MKRSVVLTIDVTVPVPDDAPADTAGYVAIAHVIAHKMLEEDTRCIELTLPQGVAKRRVRHKYEETIVDSARAHNK